MKIRRRHLEAGVPAVAMADIAFNLVLFFIILARTQDDSDKKWEPASAPKVEMNDRSSIIVMVDADKKVYLNGLEKGTGSLTSDIESLLKEVKSNRKTVLLKIHKDTPAASFQPIIEAVSQAGGDLVHVLTQEDE